MQEKLKKNYPIPKVKIYRISVDNTGKKIVCCALYFHSKIKPKKAMQWLESVAWPQLTLIGMSYER